MSNKQICSEADCEDVLTCTCRKRIGTMGFSLEHFFTEFQEILDKEGTESDELLKELEEFLVFNRGYALECGQISKI